MLLGIYRSFQKTVLATEREQYVLGSCGLFLSEAQICRETSLVLTNDFQMIILGPDFISMAVIVKFLKIKFSNVAFKASLVDHIGSRAVAFRPPCQ